MKFSLTYKSIKVFAIPAIIALLACFQLIIFGYPQGHDWIFELVRIVEYNEALSTGQGLPIWAGDLYRGFGSPVFIFYAPLYVASTALLMQIGLSLMTAAIAVLVFFSMAAAIGMAGLTREIIGKDSPDSDSAARVASVAYVLMPYFLADMLIRNASAEFVALCLTPFPFWGLALIYRGNHRGLPVLAISFALVILAHNLTGLMMAAFLSVTTAILFLPQRKTNQFFPTIAAMLISLGLSCWFWLPALGMKEHVRIDEMLHGKFDFHNNFSSIAELFSYDGLFATGWLIPVILIFCVIAIIRGDRSLLLKGLLGVGLLLVFLQTAASAMIWENIPFLPLFQFPWRMMGPLSFVAALMTGILFSKYLSHIRATEIVIMLLIAANAVPLLFQYEPLARPNYQFVSTSLNPGGIRQLGLPATVLDEYLPRAASKMLSKQTPLGALVIPSPDPDRKISAEQVSQTRIHLEISSNKSTKLQLARWYFPGWQATLNGKSYPVSKDKSGTLTVDIPAGNHQLTLWLAQPVLRLWGLAISTVSFALLVLLWLVRPWISLARQSPEPKRENL